jgi:D-3-phosphoglycerate dehydrogenase / 2-oxoglutarate reductase
VEIWRSVAAARKNTATGDAPMADANKPIVVVPDDIGGSFKSAPNIDRIKNIATVSFHEQRASSEAELIERVRSANVILSFRPAFTKFTKPVLEGAPNLRMICISGTGVEDIAVRDATERRIAVANVPGPSNRAVAEHCLALLFAVARSVPAQDRAIRSGHWTALQGIELGGKTLGIIGVSGISSELAPLARGLDMKVISWSRNNDAARAAAIGSRAVLLDELFTTSDVISLHVRLHDETHHMIGDAQFALMKHGTIIINTARGGVIDEAALLRALRSGQLAGAGLDVFAQEPLPPGHPFLTMDNVVMTPVSAWSTMDASARMINQSIENVIQFLSGAPVNVVNPAALGL